MPFTGFVMTQCGRAPVPPSDWPGGISNSIGMPYSQVSVTVILSSNSVLSSVKASN